ncbi:MAG: DnaJ domain-containing protein [Bacteroidota bacterium]
MLFEFLLLNEDSLWDVYLDSISEVVDTIKMNAPELKQEKTFQGPAAIIFSIPFLVFGLYLLAKFFQNRKWTQGVFPNVAFTKDHLFEAYISLTVTMITKDKYGQMLKLGALRSFARNINQISISKFEEKVDRNFHSPMHPGSVAKWLQLHLKENQRAHFLHFLVNIAHMERGLHKAEYELLKFICDQLGLSQSVLEEKMVYHRYEKTSQEQQTKTTYTSVSKRKQFADTLGVQENASLQEIKSQYRVLAKKFHPDRFANDSEEKKEQAHQRFIEIQEAYEFLSK